MPWTPSTLYGGRVDTVIELEGLRRRSSSARPRTSPFLGRTVVEETRRIIDYHNARVYLLEAPDWVVPIAFEGRVGAYNEVDLDLLRSWLAGMVTGGAARATLARRTSSARVFTAWLERTRRLDTDPATEIWGSDARFASARPAASSAGASSP